MTPKIPVIAVVDDEEFVCRALGRLLRSAGYAVDTFGGGTDFINSLSRRKPDCVILDVHMPRPDGFEVQAHLARERHALPIIIMTGHDTPESRERAATHHVTYLRKPIDDQLLLDSIRTALGDETGGMPAHLPSSQPKELP